MSAATSDHFREFLSRLCMMIRKDSPQIRQDTPQMCPENMTPQIGHRT